MEEKKKYYRYAELCRYECISEIQAKSENQIGSEGLKKYDEIVVKRNELYEDIWKNSATKVAKKLNVPYQKLKEACNKNNIPTPSSGYWSKLAVGQKVSPTPLPESDVIDIALPVIMEIYEKEEKTAAASVKTGNYITVESIRKSIQTYSEDSEEIALPQQQPQYKYIDSNEKRIYRRDQLYKEVWAEPVTKVALKYGLSDVAIHKACKSLNVPVPPRGYWAKLAVGQKVEITPLPEHSGIVEIKSNNNIMKREVVTKARVIPSFISAEKRVYIGNACKQIAVINDGHPIHKKILDYYKVPKKSKNNNSNKNSYSHWDYAHTDTQAYDTTFFNCVSDESLPRVYAFLDTLFMYIEALDGTVNDNLSTTVLGVEIKISVSESTTQIAHVLTKEEIKEYDNYEKEKKKYSYVTEPRVPKYDHIYNGRLCFMSILKNTMIRRKL